MGLKTPGAVDTVVEPGTTPAYLDWATVAYNASPQWLGLAARHQVPRWSARTWFPVAARSRLCQRRLKTDPLAAGEKCSVFTRRRQLAGGFDSRPPPPEGTV